MLRGAVEILPLAFSAAAYGLAFGVFSAEAGFSAAEITLMSITVFAGTSQIAAVDSFSASQAIWGSVLAAAVLNLRYIGIMATMPSILKKAPWFTRLPAIHLTADENWAQTLTARQSDEKVGVAYHVGAGATLLAFWIVATCLGNLLGAALPAWSSAAVGFTFTAAFIGMLASMLRLPPGTSLVRACKTIVPIFVTFLATLWLAQFPVVADYAILIASGTGLFVAFSPGLASKGDDA